MLIMIDDWLIIFFFFFPIPVNIIRFITWIAMQIYGS